MSVQELLSQIERRRTSLDAWLNAGCQRAICQQQHLSSGSDGQAYWHIGYKAALDDVVAYLNEHGGAEEHADAPAIHADEGGAAEPGEPGANRVRFVVCATHPAGRSAEERAGWESVARRVNDLEIERVLSVPGPEHGLQDTQSAACSVFSFDDISWELADWMLRHYEHDGLSDFMASNAQELHQAFHQQDYQTDAVDHYSLFLSAYLGCFRTRNIWTETPVAARAFEDWLAAVDATMLEKLGTLRTIGRSWSLRSVGHSEPPTNGSSLH